MFPWIKKSWLLGRWLGWLLAGNLRGPLLHVIYEQQWRLMGKEREHHFLYHGHGSAPLMMWNKERSIFCILSNVKRCAYDVVTSLVCRALSCLATAGCPLFGPNPCSKLYGLEIHVCRISFKATNHNVNNLLACFQRPCLQSYFFIIFDGFPSGFWSHCCCRARYLSLPFAPLFHSILAGSIVGLIEAMMTYS
jgi:hypothetical protein